jgi:hypothetical protein
MVSSCYTCLKPDAVVTTRDINLRFTYDNPYGIHPHGTHACPGRMLAGDYSVCQPPGSSNPGTLAYTGCKVAKEPLCPLSPDVGNRSSMIDTASRIVSVPYNRGNCSCCLMSLALGGTTRDICSMYGHKRT